MTDGVETEETCGWIRSNRSVKNLLNVHGEMLHDLSRL